MNWREVVDDVSKELNIPKEVVEKCYNLYWKSIHDTIYETDFTSHFLSKEEFEKTVHKYHIRHIGRIYLTYARYCFVWDALHPDEEPKYTGRVDNSVIRKRDGSYMTDNGRNHKKRKEKNEHKD